MSGIAAVIVNRYNIVNGYFQMTRTDGTVQAAPNNWGKDDDHLGSIIVNPTQFEIWQGAGGTLKSSAQARWDYVLDRDAFSPECVALKQAYYVGLDALTLKGQTHCGSIHKQV